MSKRPMSKSNSSQPYQGQKGIPAKKSKGFEIEFSPKTENQKLLQDSIEKHNIVVSVGSAGTGKSFTAIAIGLQKLMAGDIQKLIFIRSNTLSEYYGWLPGTIEEKCDLIFQPMMNIVEDLLPDYIIENLILEERLILAPIGYLRGTTFPENSYIVLDELQNLTPNKVFLVLSRISLGTKIICNGDITQSDLNSNETNGLIDLIKRINGESDFGLVEFTMDDIVRSQMCRRIVEIFSKKI